MSLDALANAARLRQSPGRSNFANYEEIFAADPTHVPTADEQASGAQNSAAAATALGAGPAFSGMRRAFDASRLNQIDAQLGQEADLASGRPQHIATMQAEAGNEIADLNSESAAMREFTPFKHLQHQREQEELGTRMTNQFVLPAQLRAQGDIAAAETTARGRVDAARARDGSLSMRALYDALNAIIEKTGKMPTPQEIAAAKATFGVQ